MRVSQFGSLLKSIREKQAAEEEIAEPTTEAVETPADAIPIEPIEEVREQEEDVPGDTKLVAVMNDLLADEFTAAHEYQAHYAVSLQLGFNKFAEAMHERWQDEVKHADALLNRIIFLGGKPVVDAKPKSACGMTIESQLALDLDKEIEAVQKYNAAIRLAADEDDQITKEIFEHILKDENDHVDELSTDIDKIKLMSLGNYLITQV